MKKSILNIGKSLNKKQLKSILGGSNQQSCKLECRGKYGLYGICCPENGVYVCYDGMANGPGGCGFK